MTTGLESVRRHNLEAAQARAQEILAAGRVEAQKIVDAGSAEAAALLDAARRDGERVAEMDGGREWTGARRRARGLILQAKRTSYEELRGELIQAMQSDARFGRLLLAVADAARRELGPGADVEVSRAAPAGIVAVRRNRRIRWTVEQIADQGLAGLGRRIEELWA